MQEEENKGRDLTNWLDRVLSSAPWWFLAFQAAGVLPGYLWWLVTGDAAAAKDVIRVWFPCAFAVLLFIWGVIAFCFPFYRVSKKPSTGERVGDAMLGGSRMGHGGRRGSGRRIEVGRACGGEGRHGGFCRRPCCWAFRPAASCGRTVQGKLGKEVKCFEFSAPADGAGKGLAFAGPCAFADWGVPRRRAVDG